MKTRQVSSSSAKALGLATIALALAFNGAFSLLSANFNYPDVLRRPPGEVLTMFHHGGAALILTWHAFALTALLLGPLSLALSVRGDRLQRMPAPAIGAAIAGSLASLSQAIGLWRWVFVVPSLAASYADPVAPETAKAAAASAFELINLYGGLTVGEHIGQLMTALFALMLALVQMKEGRRLAAAIGFIASATLMTGTNEGLAIALGGSGVPFGTVTVIGFLALSVWLLVTGLGLLRPGRQATPADRGAG